MKNETMHKSVNRLVKDVSRIGEDQMDIRIDFFVHFEKNMVGDAKMGRISSVALGLPHEMVFINKLASGVLSASPFAHPDLIFIDGIDEKHEFYEPHGFGYAEWYRKREQTRKASQARAAAAAKTPAAPTGVAGSSSPAPPTVASGSRMTSAKKCKTQNLLNANPLKPSTPAEVELAMECVVEAQKTSSKKKGKGKAVDVWTVAADIYRERVSSNQ